MLKLGASRGLSGLDAGEDDLAEFFTFSAQIVHLINRKHLTLHNDQEPDVRFIEFLENNAELVNKISPALGIASFAVIGRWRSAAAQ